MKIIFRALMVLGGMMLGNECFGQSPGWEWAKSLGGMGDDYSNSIALDDSGNVFITGSFANTLDFDPGAGTYNLTYSICEKLNPENCDTATVTIIVTCNSTKISGIVYNSGTNSPLSNVPVTLTPINIVNGQMTPCTRWR